MNKPKTFIASSVEGLPVAYAIQDNLKHVSEITVWDQGIFNLSESSLESLLTVLDNSDFGVFVFTPDDYLKIRGKSHLAVRDNVLFELGLFIGRLGRPRSFIIVPDNKNFHLPTDLIGLTPGKYEAARADNNLQAGTGSVCHKIRESIAKLNFLHLPSTTMDTTASEAIKENVQDKRNDDWVLLLYVDKKYSEAIPLLEKEAKRAKDEDNKLYYKSIQCFAEFSLNSQNGKKKYEDLIKHNKSNNVPYLHYAETLYEVNLINAALEVVEEGLKNCERKVNLTLLKSKCLWQINQKDEAIQLLIDFLKTKKEKDIYYKLGNFYEELDRKVEALSLYQEAFSEFPNDESVLYVFARSCQSNEHNDTALLLYNKLIEMNPNNSDYWAYTGNAYFSFELYDHALTSYEKAELLSDGKQGWVIANIGNLYNGKKLLGKAEQYLTRAQKINKKDDYALVRLSQIYTEKQETEKTITKLLDSGKAKLASKFGVG